MDRTRVAVVVLGGSLLAACAHEARPVRFTEAPPQRGMFRAVTDALAAQGLAVATETPQRITTRWQETERTVQVTGTNSADEEPISVRRRFVIELRPHPGRTEIVVRGQYETCPVTMPIDATWQPLQSCFRVWDITPSQQAAIDRMGSRVRAAVVPTRS
jgi:hypothetical protein